ncbi:MAG: aspartyl/glutamyl-tRNA amidotransferase subunit A [Spirochaetaceae bacterium]|jgi:aspartyl-tRNA(Asn)/glutamyl-tRNA(Gln) amidotransferase subunit A|nr:aspartyl/glutamyl-tRNA amidotransferase subunit A [Spirochaetaceae bacterium]
MKLPDGFEAYFKAWEEKIGAFLQWAPEKAGPRAVAPSASPDAAASAAACAASPAPEADAVTPEAVVLVEGLPFAVKDNIAVNGWALSCGSKLLEKLVSPYTATAVERITASGAWVVGKTNMDEFGMGSSTDASALQRTNNPWDITRVAGGSSGGSAAAVAAGIVPFALGSDTGGSVRQPAAFCGIVGLKPTWGAVSRYGLVAYASSLEQIGVLSDTVARNRAVFALMRGADVRDQCSRDAPPSSPPLYGNKGNKAKPGTIGVLKPESVDKAIAEAVFREGGQTGISYGGLSEAVYRGFETAKQNLAALGYKLVDVDLPCLKYAVPAYYTIATAEASANLARFDGIRYGQRPPFSENPDELVEKSRDLGFGDEVKLRILLGTFVLRSGFQDRYYLRAQRIRAGIKRSFENLLGTEDTEAVPGQVDAILLPVFPTQAFGRGDAGLSPFAQKAADIYTCSANLAGLPALAFPASIEDGLPVGVQLLGRSFSEGMLFAIAEQYEKAHPFPHPTGWKPFYPSR